MESSLFLYSNKVVEVRNVIMLTGQSLTLEQMKGILYRKEKVFASEKSMELVKKSREAVEKIVSEHKVVYGINTGFGKFSDVLIDKEHVRDLQLNLIRSHACGIGDPFPEIVSKAMVLLRANALLKGYSGVRPVVIEKFIRAG